ncbi:embryogenesis-associated protein EMB8-like protein [Tanacetum coccineum]|uniref:Embryogenesis-associated protein EMB8-like protein n=1 Tax=Tanacetum coccineum TaxID=301880 RepID=A0ABQ5ABQ7_9ASTR
MLVVDIQKANLYGVGWSMGANILVQYLGKEAHTSQFSGAVSMCNPFDLVKHLLVFEDLGGNYNIELAANAQNIREYDEGLT